MKGVIIYNQEKTYLGLGNQPRYWGEGAVMGGGGGRWGTTVVGIRSSD